MAVTTTTRLPTNLFVQGDITLAGSLVGVDRNDLGIITLACYPIPNTYWRRWDALSEPLPETPGGDDLGLVRGTFGTDYPTIQSEDLKAETGNPTNVRMRQLFIVPDEYVSGTNIRFRFHCGALTTVADDTMTIDIEAYLKDGDAAVGSDLYTGASLDCNNTTLADKDFDIDGSGITPGDHLDVRVTIAVSDAATGTAVKGQISHSLMLMNIR